MTIFFKELKFYYAWQYNWHRRRYFQSLCTFVSTLVGQNFISRSIKLWNSIAPKLEITDFSYKISAVKIRLKNALLKLRHAVDNISLTSNDYDVAILV